MSPPDNDDDSPFKSSSSLQQPLAVVLPKSMASRDEPEELDGRLIVGKGKQRSMPMPIRASTIMHDLFDMSSPSSTSSSSRPFESSSSSSSAFSPSSPNFLASDFDNLYLQHNLSVDSMEQLEFRCEEGPILSEGSISGKGKEKASFPYLPPLTFSVIQLDPTFDHSPIPGSSSSGTFYSPATTSESFTPTSPSSHSDREIPGSPSPHSNSGSPESGSQEQNGFIKPELPRCRSLSNLSQSISPLLSNVLIANNNYTNAPTTSRVPSNLTLQLERQERRNGSALLDSNNQVSGQLPASNVEQEPSSYPPAWYTVSKPSGILSPAHITTRPTFKAKTRSKSSPYPISVLDFIPHTSTDIFQPLSIVTLNYFDLILPKELRLHILRALIESHEQDHQRSIREGRLTAAKAASSKGRWVGKDKGMRELFKLSRVSKGWQALVFDGELWVDMDLRSFNFLPPTILTRLFEAAGSFVQKLNVAGHDQLDADAMSEITDSLCLTVPQVSPSYTQITSANFQGCFSLTTRSLHRFLVQSSSLEHLSVRGLSAVTNTTCDILAKSCRKLISLNLNRCPNLDGHGVGALTSSAISRKEHLSLKELRLSGLKYVTDTIMRDLGRAAPYLEVLDLSYSRQLHNSAIEAFVACESHTDHQLILETVMVSPRDLGRESNDGAKLKRRVTKLRHLNLSSCILLSDMACSNLAYSVPKLEFLELAGVGSDLKDAGLIRLLSTTHHIRRLDLEEAAFITDAVLAAITPVLEALPSTPDVNMNVPPSPKQPGYALQQLIVSHAAQLSDAAFLALIRNCPKLTVLEADDTRISAASFKEFVRLSRERKLANAKIVAVDCRGVHENVVKELTPMTRPRLGWRAYGARKLSYLDARDDNEDDLKVGQDECDENRVVVKTFYSWQTVDAVKTVREKRRKASGRRVPSDSSTASYDAGYDGIVIGGSNRSTSSARWWSPGGRTRSPRASPPLLPELNNEGCRTM